MVNNNSNNSYFKAYALKLIKLKYLIFFIDKRLKK